MTFTADGRQPVIVYSENKDSFRKLLNLKERRQTETMPEYSRILTEQYCMEHPKTKRAKFLWKMLQMSYDIECEIEDCDLLYPEQLISQERNPELKQALEDLDDVMCGY